MFCTCMYSVFLVCALVLALLTSETLPSPTLEWAGGFPYLTLASAGGRDILLSHQFQSHTGLFMVLTLLLTIAGLTSTFPTMHPRPRLMFALLFSFCASRALYGLAFSSYIVHQAERKALSFFNVPNLFTSVFVLSCTFTALRASYASASDTMSGYILFNIALVLPLLALLYAFFIADSHISGDMANGVVWCAALAVGCIGWAIRATAIVREYDSLKTSQVSESSIGSRDNIIGNNICLLSAVVSIAWTVVGCTIAGSVVDSDDSLLGPDTLIPLSTLFLLTTAKETFTAIWSDEADIPSPLVICAYASSVWWVWSGIHSILIKVHPSDPFTDLSEHSAYDFLHDGNVSIWSSASMTMPILHLLQILAPMPAIVCSSYRNEDLSEVCT